MPETDNLIHFDVEAYECDGDLAEAINREAEAYLDDPVAWFELPNPAFGGWTPSRLVDAGRAREVLEFFFQIRFIGVS